MGDLVEPSDIEQSEWPEATRAYVNGLQARVEKLERGLRDVIATDHHTFYDGPAPRHVRIARQALDGGSDE